MAFSQGCSDDVHAGDGEVMTGGLQERDLLSFAHFNILGWCSAITKATPERVHGARVVRKALGWLGVGLNYVQFG